MAEPIVVFGVDPGKTGGLALIVKEGNSYPSIIDLFALSPEEDMVDLINTIKRLILKAKTKYRVRPVAYFEKGQAYSNQGLTSTFNYGFANGCYFAPFIVFDVPIINVKPKEWQAYHKVVIPKSKAKNLDKYRRRKLLKQMSLRKAKELYPHWARVIKTHDGMSDAILIALYGISLLKGGAY